MEQLTIQRRRKRHFQVEQRRVLLRAEDVRIARAAARSQPVDRELDRVGGIEFDEIGDALGRDPVEPRHCLARQHLARFTRS